MRFPPNKQKITETCNNHPPTAPRTIVVYEKVISRLLVVRKSIYSYYITGGEGGGVVYEENLGDEALLTYFWMQDKNFDGDQAEFRSNSLLPPFTNINV